MKNRYLRFLQICGLLFLAAFMTGCGQKEDLMSFSAVPSQQAAESGEPSEEDGPEVSQNTAEPVEPAGIFVHVCGAVKTPGVYELPADARICEAVALAGGGTEDASMDSLNLARPLMDGERIYVPTQEEAEAGIAGGWTADPQTDNAFGTNGNPETGKVNLNRATKEELMTLPGIGEAKADSILEYREQKGPFGTIEEIMQISGIKNSIYEKIKDYICV